MKRLYLVPVRDACNSNCSFCYMKEKRRNFSKPQFLGLDNLSSVIEPALNEISEVEITGGGEPTLHSKLNEIIAFFQKNKIYTKLYTNGFLLKDLPQFDEVNISRVHWDSKINNLFYNSFEQNDLLGVLKHYKKYAKKIRLQIILIKGAIDSKEKLLEFIDKYGDLVDIFMVRTLFPRCNLEKDNFVDYFDLDHLKIKFDRTLDDYSKELFFAGTDGVLHEKFQY